MIAFSLLPFEVRLNVLKGERELAISLILQNWVSQFNIHSPALSEKLERKSGIDHIVYRSVFDVVMHSNK